MVDTAVVLLRKNPTLGRHVFVSFDRSWLYVKTLDRSSKPYHELEGKGRKLFGWDSDSAVSSEVSLPTILLTLAITWICWMRCGRSTWTWEARRGGARPMRCVTIA
jgi:hypothetical protein